MNSRLCSLLLIVMLSQSPVGAEEKGVTGGIMINASEQNVWETLEDTKHFDDKIISAQTNEAVVEQTFEFLPLLGSTTATVKVTLVPRQRISYNLLKSNHLKALSGSWVLTPSGEHKTHLQLSTYVDPGLPLPRFIINKFIGLKVRGRLRKAKLMAEALEHLHPGTNPGSAAR